MKIIDFLKKRKNTVVFTSLLVVVALLSVHTVLFSSILSVGSGGGEVTTTSNINPGYQEIVEQSDGDTTAEETSVAIENTESSSKPKTKKPTATAKETADTTAATTAATTQAAIPFATAIPPQTPADYSEQWNLGYLIAIDNPDKTYACSQVNLTDEDRDLLERLCMGEFGSGGFIGACLIAQAVKDAMCFDGYTSVAEVIKKCRYTGSIDIGTSDACRQAVQYIFDENHDAVQHRIMYMYNPYMVRSAFHESQNFILSYCGVRFFDRWGY